MRSRIPRQAAVGHGPNRAELESRLTDELASVVGGARRRALRDGDRQIDTAHLLHSLLEADPQVRAAFDPPQVARLLGYLVQRSIGYGLRWQIGVEDAGAGPEAPGVPGWSPLAARAMTEAHERAARRGADRAHGVDLLAAIASAPASRAVEVLRHTGVDARGTVLWSTGGGGEGGTGSAGRARPEAASVEGPSADRSPTGGSPGEGVPGRRAGG